MARENMLACSTIRCPKRSIKSTIGCSMEGSFLQLSKGMHDMPCGTTTKRLLCDLPDTDMFVY